jgi:hypothetical protein
MPREQGATRAEFYATLKTAYTCPDSPHDKGEERGAA